MFKAPDNVESQLQFEHEVILKRYGREDEVIMATKPGPTFDSQAAYRSLGTLLGRVVTKAIALSDGWLGIIFDDSVTLVVNPDNYEAWHFQQPAPSIHLPSTKDLFSLTGYGGGLI